MHRSGFVTIVGKPNVGKSTFINQIIGEKIAIVSEKPQTTRNTIRGIFNTEDSQIIFIDTPGIHKPKHRLGALISDAAVATIGAVDLVLWMINAVEPMEDIDMMIAERLQSIGTPTFLILNKTDLAEDFDRLATLVEKYRKLLNFKGVFGISALKNQHLDALLKDIGAALPEGPKYYPEDQVTDHPEKFMIAELIREKVLRLTHEEVPHSVTVLIDSMATDDERPHLMNIHATVVVERDSQKGIIIGKGGNMLKQIGTQARHDILALLGMKIYLDLHVKVIKNWRNKDIHLRNFGYNESL